MKLTIEKGRTLLIDGPASVKISSGSMEIFGFKPEKKNKIILRKGKRLPFFTLEKANVEVTLGKNSNIKEVESSTIPPSWTIADTILNKPQKKPTIIMVLGGVNSGKTSFCVYLSNKLVIAKQKVAIIDEDLGQSDIGPPGTVAYAFATKPVIDFYELSPTNVFFVGTNSPSMTNTRTIEGVKTLKTEILSKEVDFIIINTDGWMNGEDAVQFKTNLTTAIEPDYVFCLENKREPFSCEILKKALPQFNQEIVESPNFALARDQETRKNLRELSYRKYLHGSKEKTYTLSQVAFEEMDYKVQPLQNNVKDLLVGLYNKQKKFLGIGIIREINYSSKIIRIFTPAAEEPSSLSFGQVRIDKNLHEYSEKE